MLKRAMLWLIRGYQRVLSPLLPPSCRFTPTCSHYTYECIERFGPLRGGWLGFKRICRCQPFCKGGFDPVPLPEELNANNEPHKLDKKVSDE